MRLANTLLGVKSCSWLMITGYPLLTERIPSTEMCRVLLKWIDKTCLSVSVPKFITFCMIHMSISRKSYSCLAFTESRQKCQSMNKTLHHRVRKDRYHLWWYLVTTTPNVPTTASWQSKPDNRKGRSCRCRVRMLHPQERLH